MNKTLNCLIIENQQLSIDSYLSALDYICLNYRDIKFNTDVTKNCEAAITKIDQAKKNSSIIDLVFLDINLPPDEKRKIFSGDDLGIILKKSFPQIKIIILTHIDNNYRLVNILRTINPNCLLLKSELNFQNLVDSIINVIEDIPAYSNQIIKLLKLHISNDFNLDTIDRQILYYISLGIKTKNLPKFIQLSLGGIERRKRKLKLIFNITEDSDSALIKIAQEYGFV